MTDDRDDDLPAPFPAQPAASPFPPPDAPRVHGSPLNVPQPDPDSDWNAGADAHDLVVDDGSARPNPLLTLGRFAFPPSPPLDDEGVAARDRRWTSRTLVFLTLFLLIFNGASVQNWSRQQAPGWVTSTVQQLSDVWETQIAQLGADQPRRAVRTAYDTSRDQRFIGQPPPP